MYICTELSLMQEVMSILLWGWLSNKVNDLLKEVVHESGMCSCPLIQHTTRSDIYCSHS